MPFSESSGMMTSAELTVIFSGLPDIALATEVPVEA
ncbi:hypothetical protein SGGBAA2069_c07870 [Streptococcus gallolyticus subsp. gallolyticus ATCC BAA-2069]|nr:hypothetical protein SGGBAA2069_c07870 [Streptococcus gallolyticus subsp. gallolyticus ATCC BAA-2069]